MPPLPHHRAYGSVLRRFGGLSTHQLFHGKQPQTTEASFGQGATRCFRRAQPLRSLGAEDGRTGRPFRDLEPSELAIALAAWPSCALPRGTAISKRCSICPTPSSPSGRALASISAISLPATSTARPIWPWGIVNLSGRGMLVVSVARRLGEPEEVTTLAEAEHERYNAERLRRQWQLGERDPLSAEIHFWSLGVIWRRSGAAWTRARLWRFHRR